MSNDYIPVNVPKKLYEAIEKKVAESHGEFKNVEEYVEFVLTEVIRGDEEYGGNVNPPEAEGEEKDRVKKISYI